MKFNLEQTLTFIHVVETKSFSKAAERLGMSKAIVSQRITALEKHLNTQLLQRTTRKLILTEAGQTFYHRLKGTLVQIDEAIEEVQAHQSEPKGTLKVTAPSGFIRSIRRTFLVDFVRQHPNVHLDIHIVQNPLHHFNDEFDLLICPHMQGLPLPDLNLVAKKLLSSRGILCATDAFIAKYGQPKNPKDLLNFNCLAPFDSPWPFKRADGELYYIQPTGNVRANSDDIIYSLVMADLAIAYSYPSLFIDELKHNTITPLLNNEPTVNFDLYAMYPVSAYQPLRLKLFLNKLKAFYDQQQVILDQVDS